MASATKRRLPKPRSFRDRADAGRYLAGQLADLSGRNDLLVLGIPRGGVPVAWEVARALHAPLDVIAVRKLGYPGAEELAMGAIASGGIRVLNQEVLRELPVPPKIIDLVAARELKELERRERAFRGGRPPLEPRGKTVIVVDDGLATGSSMRAAVMALRQRDPAAVVAAVPVGATETCRSIAQLVDRFECVIESPEFFAVGVWYEDFSQTTDDEVRRLLHGLKLTPMPDPPGRARQKPDFFIEDSGKTATTVLRTADAPQTQTRPQPGDRVVLSVAGRRLAVKDPEGAIFGYVEPRLASHLIGLIKSGNRYEAGVLSIAGRKLALLIRETSQAPSLVGTPSFRALPELQEIDTGPYDKRTLGVEATDLEGYLERFDEYEEEWPPAHSALLSKEDELLADQSDEEKEADAAVATDELEQAAREHELAVEAEDLGPDM